MTASPATTVNEIPDFAWLELGHRESVIADVLAYACAHDRQIAAVGRAVDERLGSAWYDDGSFEPFLQEVLVQKPVDIADAITGMHSAVALLSVALYPAAAELVERALAFDNEWLFDNWPIEKREAALRSMFERAGIAERFEPRRNTPDEDDLPAKAVQS